MNIYPQGKIFSLSILTVLILSGCATSEGLNTRNKMLNAKTLQANETLSGVQFSPARWPQRNVWQSFNDPQLNALIRDGLASSPTLQEANARADKANASVTAARAAQMPDINMDASLTRSRVAKVDDPLLEGKNYSTLRTTSLGASYMLDLWGGKKAAWEAALGNAKASELDKQAASLSLSANIARAWNNLNTAWKLEKIAAANAGRLKKISEIQRQFYQGGLSPEYQYKQALANNNDAQATWLQTQENVTTAGIKLSTLVGKGPDYWRYLKPAEQNITAQDTLPSVIPAELVGRRPDVVAARWRVEAAEKQITATKTAFYPNINLVAEAGTRNLLGDAFVGAPSQFFNVGPTLSLPIFDGGKRRADLASSNADWDIAVAHYNSLLVSAIGDISTTIVRMKSLEQQRVQSEEADKLAHSAWDDVSAQFKAGIRPWLDVLSLQDQLLASDRNLVQMNADIMDQNILLIEQLGGGVVTR
ncbi:efflux transporter outer membrane subunit [Kosakonia sp.]|uniref:efflux transporter outer membrane subunit n=1 Tax=Kosakonia sp. TaxID=1916651 RepID=UPI002898098C|nr:efflux transporter outer membrane subunit [Kosakonia sp.]